MPIVKDGNGTIIYSAPEKKDLFELSGVAHADQFAVCDRIDVLKQINLDPSAQTTNTSVTLKSAAGNVGNVVLTLPNASGTLATSSGSGDSFNIIQTPAGTSPTATGQSTLTLTASGIVVTGNSATDTIDFTLSTVTEARGGTNQTTYATGDMLHATAANTLGKLSAGAQGQQLTMQSTGLPGWQEQGDISRQLVLYEDFTGGFYGSGLCGTSWSLIYGTSGTGAAVQNNIAVASPANPGVMELTTGTTTTGLSWVNDLAAGVRTQYLGGGVTAFEIILKPSALSDATETYFINAGIEAGSNTTLGTDGVLFRYTHGLNSGRWTAYCVKSSVSTALDTGVAVSTSAFHKLRFVVNAAASSVEFFVNGSSVGTISTNIPLTTTALRHFAIIAKSAGTTSRSLYIDAMKRTTFFTTPR